MTELEVVRKNRNKRVHPWFHTYWMALVWAPCGVSSPKSVVSFPLCIDHSENTHDFLKWLPVHNRRLHTKAEINLFILIVSPFKWRWSGLSSMHGLRDPLSHYFFPRDGFSTAILNRDDHHTRFWWKWLTNAKSLLHTKFEVSSARSAWVISFWKAGPQYYKVHTFDDSKWPPWWNRRLYAKIEINLSILDWRPLEWHWFGYHVVYRSRDPLSHFSYALVIVRMHMIFQNGRQRIAEGHRRKRK